MKYFQELALFCVLGLILAAYPAAAQVVSSYPPNGMIDARGSCSTSVVQLTLNHPVANLQSADFGVAVNSGFVAPHVDRIQTKGNSVSVYLSSGIPQGSWTTIGLKQTGESVCVGALPGDVNQNRMSIYLDVMKLIPCILLSKGCSLLQTDINCSNQADIQDIRDFIVHYRNTPGVTSWNRATLPESCPILAAEPQPTPTPIPNSAEIMQRGLAAFRSPDGNGVACNNCHSPDGFELAVAGFDDDTLRRRASPHLSNQPAKIDDIIAMIHLLRHNYGLSQQDPMNFRPFSPGPVLPGNTVGERDMAFGQELQQMGLALATGEVDSLAKAQKVVQELSQVNIRTLRTGIEFNRFSEDPFRGAEQEAFALADWMTQIPQLPIAGSEAQWRELQQRYLANPTDENFAALYQGVDQLTSIQPFMNPNRITAQFMMLKYKSLLVMSHLKRKEAMGYDFAHDKSYVFDGILAKGNPVYALGAFTAAFSFMPQKDQAAWLAWPSFVFDQMPAGWTLIDQFTKIRLPWLLAGLYLDSTLNHIDTGNALFFNDPDEWNAFSLNDWLYVPDDEFTFERPSGYAIHNAFFTAWQDVQTLLHNPEVGGYGFRSYLLWNFGGFLVQGYRNDPPIPLSFEPRDSVEHRDLFRKVTKNYFKAWLYLLEDDLKKNPEVMAPYPYMTTFPDSLERIRAYLNQVETPEAMGALNARINSILLRIDPNYAIPPRPQPAYRYFDDYFEYPVPGADYAGEPLTIDYDGDGDTDIIYPAEESIVFFPNENGRFDATRAVVIPSQGRDVNGQVHNYTARTVDKGDFNGDGYPDLLIGGFAPSGVNLLILLNNGRNQYPGPAHFIHAFNYANDQFGRFPSIRIADFNRDGLDDILLSDLNRIDSAGALHGFEYVNLLQNKGNVGQSNWFQETYSVDPNLSGNVKPYGTVIADFNRDGYLDFSILVTYHNLDSTKPRVLVVYLNNRVGGFTQQAPMDLGNVLFSAVGGDFNGDGIPDMAVSSETFFRVLFGRGDGTFSPTDWIHLHEMFQGGRPDFPHGLEDFGGAMNYRMIPADLDHDGDLDLVIRPTSKLYYWGDWDIANFGFAYNLDHGQKWQFQLMDVPNYLKGNFSETGLGVADFDQNGLFDVVMSFSKTKTFDVFFGQPPSLTKLSF